VRLLVAGMTGQLGAGLIEVSDPELVELVSLARPLATRGGGARLRAAYPTRPELADSAVDGDVTQPSWDLDDGTIRRLAMEVDGVLNAAGETNWAAGRRQLDAVNVLGAVRGYELACALEQAGGGRKLYCYCSSIHAAGTATGRLAEVPFDPHERRTPYELSKWLGEMALLERAGRDRGPNLCIARVGGLLGSSTTGATRRRNSLYMLADRAEALPLNLLPLCRDGRIDMLARDVAAQLLLDALLALHASPPEQTEILHICAGESAPSTVAVLRALDSVDLARRRSRPRLLPLPVGAILAASEQLQRYHQGTRTWHNALIGLRYLSLDRIFERSRLAALIPSGLPSASIEQLVRLAFDLPAQPPPPVWDTMSLARFAG
jgi:nucleoside-diphosphate-sugar epimerase